MWDIVNKYRKPAMIIGIVGLIAFVSWLIYYSFFTFHVNSTSPSTSSVSYLTPQLLVTFNKGVSEEGLEVTSDNLSIRSEVNGSSIQINIFTAMKPGTEYVISLKSVSSTDGYQLNDYKIRFKPTSSSDSLSERDRELILERQQANKSELVSDPILNYLPHSTLNYSITPFIDNAQTDNAEITIEVAIELSAADVRIDREGTITIAKQEALTYLQSLEGIDLTKYNIIYKINEPVL